MPINIFLTTANNSSLRNQCQSGGTAESNIGELELGIIEALAFALFLPVVDHLGGLVQHLNALVIGDPALAFDLGLEGFPGIFPGPEEVRSKK